MKVTTAERLKQIMREENLKQVDILERSKKYCEMYDRKLTKADLSQYVSGKVIPGQDKLFILALVLNVSEAWLMGFNVPRERKTKEADTETGSETQNAINKLKKSKRIQTFINSIDKVTAEQEELVLDIVMNVIDGFIKINEEDDKK